jgi:hypothetical protein
MSKELVEALESLLAEYLNGSHSDKNSQSELKMAFEDSIGELIDQFSSQFDWTELWQQVNEDE